MLARLIRIIIEDWPKKKAALWLGDIIGPIIEIDRELVAYKKYCRYEV